MDTDNGTDAFTCVALACNHIGMPLHVASAAVSLGMSMCMSTSYDPKLAIVSTNKHEHQVNVVYIHYILVFISVLFVFCL